MDIRKLQRAIVDGLEDVKAHNIRVFNTEHLSPLFERVIIASGTSNRQTKALAASVRDAVKSRGLPVLRTEGEANGEWIIVDCGAAVAHIMQPGIRDYYHLEEIWGEKPVRMRMGDDGGAPSRVAANDEQAQPVRMAGPARRPVNAKAPASGKKAAAKTTAGKASVGKTVARKTAKSAAKKPAARKTLARKAVTRTVGVKSTAAKPVSTRPAASRKAPARRVPAKGASSTRRG